MSLESFRGACTALPASAHQVEDEHDEQWQQGNHEADLQGRNPENPVVHFICGRASMARRRSEHSGWLGRS